MEAEVRIRAHELMTTLNDKTCKLSTLIQKRCFSVHSINCFSSNVNFCACRVADGCVLLWRCSSSTSWTSRRRNQSCLRQPVSGRGDEGHAPPANAADADKAAERVPATAAARSRVAASFEVASGERTTATESSTPLFSRAKSSEVLNWWRAPAAPPSSHALRTHIASSTIAK